MTIHFVMSNLQSNQKEIKIVEQLLESTGGNLLRNAQQ